ncbi:uncharacterized protein LOC108045062 isoform X4 [Drosophila rhopaloa]|uniref:Uncharacterized protein LOC108045062 isoform X3 n=1 Tax=Drosophila rhopaloa TaxID=1041015 RepID=A0A6P4EXA6_DRORH|nr:uncharacterized protein LOC108045062 isoform X4 [Drosophila rhopaloa]
MSRNRRRSLPCSTSPSDEEQPAQVEQNGNGQTSLRSRSLSSQELLVQASSVFENEARTPAPQVVDVAVGTESRTEILDWSTSSPSLDQDQWNEEDLSSFYEGSSLHDLPKFSLRNYPHILVEPTKGAKESDTDPKSSQPKENPPTSTPIEPISEVPFEEPIYEKDLSPAKEPTKFTRPHIDRLSSVSSDVSPSSLHQSSFEDDPSMKFASINEILSLQRSTSSSDLYYKEEPLITKTQKFYKKRAPLVPRYDSEDSYAINKEFVPQDVIVETLGVSDTESPDSFSEYDAEKRKNSDMWDTGSRSIGSKESFTLSRAGGRLGSGMVFVNLHGDTTRRRFRLGDHGAVIPGPANHRWPDLHRGHPTAIYGQGSGRGEDGGAVRGQCPDWLLLYQWSIRRGANKSVWFPEGWHRRGTMLLIRHYGLRLEREPGYADLLLQRSWWHVVEPDLGEFAADRGLLFRAVSSDGPRLLLQWRWHWDSALYFAQQLASAHHRVEEHGPGAERTGAIDPANGHVLCGSGSHPGGTVPPPGYLGDQFG